MNLYNLTGNFLTISKMIEEDCDNEALIGTLESLTDAIEVKSQNIVYLTKNMEGYSNGLGDEIKRLQAKQKAIDNKVESLKQFMFGQLELAGLKEVKTTVATIKQQKNPASVMINDASKIPAKYQTVVPESYVPRKVDIAKDLKAGIDVPGCELKNSTRWVIK